MTASAVVRRRTGGRPPAAEAAQLGERIVAAASALFLRDGYAGISVEAIAAAAGVSKRTFYARFDGKGAVFLAVVRSLVGDWLVGFDQSFEAAPSLEAALLIVARKMLDVALTPTGLALHALLTSETMRFPELAAALRQSGGDVGVTTVAGLLQRHLPRLTPEVASFVAEQFQVMVVAVPRRRAMALGVAFHEAARERWCVASVELLLRGAAAI